MISIYHEIWKRRDLILNFAISDLKLRYRNSVLGFFWTFLEPLLLLSVLYLVFTNLFQSSVEHYALYLLLGIILWEMFSRGTDIGLNCVASRNNLLTQTYFALEIPSISSGITTFFMLIFEFMVFGIFLAVLQFTPPGTIIFLPLVLFLELILVIGLCFPLSVLNVRYKDVQFIWKVIIQAGFFLTPIFYKFDMLPQGIQQIMYYSPMVQIVEIAHGLTIYNALPTSESVFTAIGSTLAVFVLGYGIFRIVKRRIVEEL